MCLCMTFERSNFLFFLAFILIGAVLGSALGALAERLIPGISVINDNLTGPIGFNLEVITFNIRLNLSAITGLVIGAVIFRKV